MSPTRFPHASEITLSRNEGLEFSTRWVWAGRIIGFGVVFATGGPSGEPSKQDAVTHANIAMTVPPPFVSWR